MRTVGLVTGWFFLALSIVAISAPDSWLGGDRQILIIRAYAGASAFFAMAANYRKEHRP